MPQPVRAPPGDESDGDYSYYSDQQQSPRSEASYSTSSSYTQDTERSFAAAEPQLSPPPKLQPELEEGQALWIGAAIELPICQVHCIMRVASSLGRLHYTHRGTLQYGR